jgi:hypothetical protein
MTKPRLGVVIFCLKLYKEASVYYNNGSKPNGYFCFIKFTGMKIILSFLIFTTVTTTAKAQSKEAMNELINNYYILKNALVNGQADKAAAGATALVNSINKMELDNVSTEAKKTFQSLQPQLLAAANTLAASKEINKQREVFSGLSENMISLLKAVKTVAQPVYVQYCPMKKAYWLSAEQAIKNPYYGSSMLTCGSVKDTIK